MVTRSDVMKAMLAAVIPATSTTEDTYVPLPNAIPKRVNIETFAKTHGKPVVVFCLEGTVTLGKGRFAVQKQAQKLWYCDAEFHTQENGIRRQRLVANPAIMWPTVVVGQSAERALKRFISSLARSGVPVMR